ncbi:LysM peptidoglycan-binding domain-containing protein [Sphingomonas sp. Tas61C01]|uniref:LysM peptidoglycan-binding domain-containing protein n=1 Tax=Sphingomonas sp. Tas61C01 TaxID=3458297 RepID=UPI00403ECE68
MTKMSRSPFACAPRIAVLALATAVAACAGGGPKPAAQLPAPPSAATATSEIDAIIALLDAGDTKTAQRRINAALKRDPMNASVQVLRDSIAQDPRELLGPVSHPYVTKAGDTMNGLADRFLGTRLKGYQLSRYNGIAVPATLAAGQTLRIPGEAPRAEPIHRAEPRATAPAVAAPRPKPVAAKPVAAAKPPANPVAARQARAAGLAALNQGDVVRATNLLRRASFLDPANPTIARDLGRAQRIAATVKARR